MSLGNFAWLRRIFLKNKTLKFLSFVVAVLAWYAIRGTVGAHGPGQSVPTIKNGDATLRLTEVPVSVVVRPEAVVSVEVLPARVDVILAGSSSVLQKLGRADIRVVVDCVGLQSSTNYDLPVVVNVPERMDVSAVAQPAFVRAVLSQERSK